jgi:uncharacterized OB-fold protein
MSAGAIAYQRCGKCANVWYFRRDFCPRCGNDAPQTANAAGQGTVEAVTVVTRAPSAELRAYAPYTMVLVAMDEGFRVMAHAEPGVAIGDTVEATQVAFGERSIPKFKRK